MIPRSAIFIFCTTWDFCSDIDDNKCDCFSEFSMPKLGPQLDPHTVRWCPTFKIIFLLYIDILSPRLGWPILCQLWIAEILKLSWGSDHRAQIHQCLHTVLSDWSGDCLGHLDVMHLKCRTFLPRSTAWLQPHLRVPAYFSIWTGVCSSDSSVGAATWWGCVPRRLSVGNRPWKRCLL